MPFEKGNKLGGRKEGAVNKRTKEALKRIEHVLSILDETIDTDLKAISPKDRAMLWIDCQEFIRPKLQRSTVVNEGTQNVNINVNYPDQHNDSPPSPETEGVTG